MSSPAAAAAAAAAAPQRDYVTRRHFFSYAVNLLGENCGDASVVPLSRAH